MKKTLTLMALGATFVLGASTVTVQAQDTAATVKTIDSETTKLVDTVYPAFVLIGGGSGVCISPDGYFVTNHHVWSEAAVPTHMLVKMAGNPREFTADAIGADPRGDIVLGKLRLKEGETVPFAPLGDSDAVQVGDICLAIGNPFLLSGSGSEPTVTLGTVSATHRFQGGYNDSIQIDTAINPGNSGGPSFNIKGEVIGINGRNIASHGKRYNTGAGYAIPSNQIKNLLPVFKAQLGGANIVRHGLISGLKFDMTRVTGGAKITEVDDDTAASDAGFKVGDVIVKADQYPIVNVYRYYGVIGTKARGSTFDFVVKRDGKEVKLTATLDTPVHSGQFSTIPVSDAEGNRGSGRNPFGGMMQDPFKLPAPKATMGLSVRVNDDRKVGGVLVSALRKVGGATGPAETAGLAVDDIITEINDRKIMTLSDLRDILIALKPEAELKIKYLRAGEAHDTTLVVAKRPGR